MKSWKCLMQICPGPKLVTISEIFFCHVLTSNPPLGALNAPSKQLFQYQFRKQVERDQVLGGEGASLITFASSDPRSHTANTTEMLTIKMWSLDASGFTENNFASLLNIRKSCFNPAL